MGTRKTSEYTLNITPELFEAWKKLRRNKDSEAIATRYGFSRPIVDRALNKGYCAKPEILQRITEFFTERQELEKATAERLLNGEILTD